MKELDFETMPIVNSSSEISDTISETECRDFWDSHHIGEGLIAEDVDEEHAEFLRAMRAKRRQSSAIALRL